MVVCGRTGGNRSRKLAYLRSNIILSARVARDSATNSRERAGRGQGGPRHVPTPVGAVSAASSVLGSALSSSIGSSTRATANARTPAGRSRARAVASRNSSRRAAQRPRWRDVGLRARRRTSRNHGPTALSQLCLSHASCASTPAPEIAWCARAAERGARRAPGSPRRWSDFERDRSRPVIAVRFEACDGLAGNSRPTRVEHAQRALASLATSALDQVVVQAETVSTPGRRCAIGRQPARARSRGARSGRGSRQRPALGRQRLARVATSASSARFSESFLTCARRSPEIVRNCTMLRAAPGKHKNLGNSGGDSQS